MRPLVLNLYSGTRSLFLNLLWYRTPSSKPILWYKTPSSKPILWYKIPFSKPTLIQDPYSKPMLWYKVTNNSKPMLFRCRYVGLNLDQDFKKLILSPLDLTLIIKTNVVLSFKKIFQSIGIVQYSETNKTPFHSISWYSNCW